MTTLDDPRRIVDPSSISVWPTAMKYGGILALVLMVVGLIMHIMGMSDPANPSTLSQIMNCLNNIAIAAVVVFAIKAHRDKDLGGYMTMGRGIGVGTATSLVIGVISAIWMIIFMTAIDPGLGDAIKDAAMEKAQPGQEEMTEKIVGIFSNPYTLAIFVLVATVFIGFFTALIASAIMKKDPAPNV